MQRPSLAATTGGRGEEARRRPPTTAELLEEGKRKRRFLRAVKREGETFLRRFATEDMFYTFTAHPTDVATYSLAAIGPRRYSMDLRKLHSCLAHIDADRHLSRTEVADIFTGVSRGQHPAPLAIELGGGLLDPSDYEPTADPSLIGLGEFWEIMRRIALIVAPKVAQVQECDLAGEEYYLTPEGKAQAEYDVAMETYLEAMQAKSHAAWEQRTTFLARLAQPPPPLATAHRARMREANIRSHGLEDARVWDGRTVPGGNVITSAGYAARLFGDAPSDKTREFEPFVERHAGFVSVPRAPPAPPGVSGAEIPGQFQGYAVRYLRDGTLPASSKGDGMDSDATRRAHAVDDSVLRTVRQAPSRHEIASRLLPAQPSFCPDLGWIPGAFSDAVRKRGEIGGRPKEYVWRVMPEVAYPPVTSSTGISRTRLDSRLAEHQLKGWHGCMDKMDEREPGHWPVWLE